MNSFKKFLNKKKIQNHFKKSGEGARLDSGESSSKPSINTGASQGGHIDRVAAADIAAQAAMKRMMSKEPNEQDKSKKRIQMLAKKELDEERREKEGITVTKERRNEPDVREFDHSSVISQIYYTCELLGGNTVKTKTELMKDIEELLNEEVSNADDPHDKIIASILMLYSLNKQNIRQTAVDTIGKYLQNILEHPEESKYKSIRIGNKAFQDRVCGAKGGRKFLEAVGFREKTEGNESFLVFSSESDEHLCDALESLRNGQSVPIKVARNMEIFALKEGQRIVTPKLADDFFNLTAEELKMEQAIREDQVERMLSLRTKEMRLKDEQLRNYKYKYTLIRIRLPGNMLVQGVFSTFEPYSNVISFVNEVLSETAQSKEYTLSDASGHHVDDESKTLAQIGLAPAAVLHLNMSEIPSEGVLSDNLVEMVKQLD